MTEDQKVILRQCVERAIQTRFSSREAAIELYEEMLHAAIGTDAPLEQVKRLLPKLSQAARKELWQSLQAEFS